MFEKYSFIPNKHKVFNLFIENRTLENLFLGDSHTEEGINPYFINNNSFNYGFSGESYIENYYRLKRLISSGTIPKRVFLEIDYSMVEDYSRFRRSLYLMKNDLSFEDFVADFDFKIVDFINYNFGFIGRGKYYGLIFRKSRNISNLGYISNNRTYLPKKNNHVINKKLKNLDLIYFKKILNLTEKNNISLYFIKYPLSRESLEYYNPENRKIYFKTLNLIISKFYGENKNSIIILDYQNFYINNYSVFADLSHLNTFGAKSFSKQLSKDLDKLNIIKSQK